MGNFFKTENLVGLKNDLNQKDARIPQYELANIMPCGWNSPKKAYVVTLPVQRGYARRGVTLTLTFKKHAFGFGKPKNQWSPT